MKVVRKDVLTTRVLYHVIPLRVTCNCNRTDFAIKEMFIKCKILY